MGIVRPHLWFHDQAEQAAQFYVSVIPNSSITSVVRAPAQTPGVDEGTAFVVDLVLDGEPVTLLNGGPAFTLNEAFSFVVQCPDQDAVDRYWDALVEGGGEHSQCGWLKDRFGVSWQVVPDGLGEILADGSDPAARDRAMAVLMGQTKIVLAELRAAFDGAGT